jgi:hypothetical protein
MAYRVIQWGAGVNGQALIRSIAAHADLELVGCRVWSEAKNGVDAGTLAGIDALGVSATSDLDELLGLNADIVLFCGQLRPDLQSNDDQICALLRSGKNVISVTGAHSMPMAFANGYAAQFETACRIGNSSMAAAGINPGFIAERLAATVTGLCAEVDSVSVQEAFDCSNSTADIVFDTMGFGLPLAEWRKDSPVGGMFNHLFFQLIHNVAHRLGVELADVSWTASVAPAPHDIHIDAGTVRAGTVAAITQIWEGIPSDPKQIRISKHTSWVLGKDIPGHPVRSGWQIRVEGKPSIAVDVRYQPDGDMTYYSESMVGSAISVIPEVIAAPPGFLLPQIYAPFRKRFPGS